MRRLVLSLSIVFSLAAPAAAQDVPRLDSAVPRDRGETDWLAPPADALPTEPDPVARPVPVATTISGGASMGAYEAGAMYYSVEAMRASPERVHPVVFAGTSAGSINAFLSVLSLCTEAPRDPESSHFFRTWSAIGIEELFDPDQVKPNAIFTRRGFGPVEQLRRAWNAGLREDCDLLLGITATRMRPREVEVGGGVLSLPRMAERFLVRIRGRGPGRPPRVDNYVSPHRRTQRPLLPLDGPDARPFDAILQAILASSCFPIAFEPQPIAHCLGSEGPCTPDRAETDLFLDGGFYSNQPLRLAVDAVQMGVTSEGPPAILPRPDDSRLLPQDTTFLFVDPELYAFPLPDDEDDDEGDSTDPDLVPYVLTMAGDFIRTARTAELHALLESVPEARKMLFTNRVNHPLASASLGAFMGFFDRELRRFDFHLGMYDARRTLIERLPAGPGASRRWDLPDERTRPHAARLGWRPFDCLRYVFDGFGSRNSCAGEDLRDFRILLRVSLERLWDDCLRSERPSPACVDARAGRAVPRVPFVRPRGGWRSREDEADYAWLLRRLGAHGFAFRDLGLDPSRSEEGAEEVRLLLAEMSRSLSRAQNELSLPIELASEVAVNTLEYRAPTNLFQVTAGIGLDIGWSGTRPGTAWEWLRLTVALELRGLTTLVSSDPSWFGLAPLVGLEAEILPLSGGIIQPRVGARGGFVFSTGDGWLAGNCGVAGEETVPCSRPLVQGYLALSFFQVLRILLILEVQPAVRPDEPDLWVLRPGIGFTLPFE